MEHSATHPNPPVIEMRDVSVSKMQGPEQVVTEHVNWTVATGDYWVIAALQGSGKSDFLLMTAGLMPPLSGKYLLFGEEMPIFEEARLKTRLRLGLVFDGGQLFSRLTIQENIALPLLYHQNPKPARAQARVQAWLDLMELNPWANSPPAALGRQWQKRAGLARALILEPDILLVDNPLGGLDRLHAHWWLNFLDQLAKGHEILRSKPMTLVVTSLELGPWRGRARQFAALKERRFNLLGTGPELEKADDFLVREPLPLAAEGARQ